ncbi:MAG TPA: glycosyltransferase [Longimicrobiales bacterium]|nr:glycosyltransferase [Longimicrobiales bacterium]
MFSLLDVVAALPWLAIAIVLPLIVRNRPRLEDVAPRDDADGPLVSIIVPARNEAENIGTCVATLLDSSYARREIIVVDDHSTDGTGDIARILAERGGGMVRLVESAPLPEGWVGKCWACWQGYQAARGDVLLFTDADTRHDEALLAHALGALRDTGASLVSVAPRQLMHGFWERTVLPHIFLLIYTRFRDLERVNRARNPRDVIANGQFLLFPRTDYEALDGHRGVKGEVVEDLRLAQRAVETGRRIWIARADRLMETRMYSSLSAIVEGWSKNLAMGSRNTVDEWLRPILPWAAGLLLILLWVVPPLVLGLAFLGVVDSGLIPWASLATGASAVFWLIGYARMRVPVLNALMFPVGGLAAGLLFLRSAARGGSVGWKGRTYQVDGSGGVRAPDTADS